MKIRPTAASPPSFMKTEVFSSRRKKSKRLRGGFLYILIELCTIQSKKPRDNQRNAGKFTEKVGFSAVFKKASVKRENCMGGILRFSQKIGTINMPKWAHAHNFGKIKEDKQ